MTMKYFAILTNQGTAKLANATALGTQLKLTHMATGDGNGSLPTPDPAQTKLVNQKRIAPLNMLFVDPGDANQIIAEQVIPENEGGFWIREIGLYDADGTLIAVANCPETYKPLLLEGSARTQTLRMALVVSATSAVSLKIDPAVVLATRKYVDDKVIEVKAYTDNQMKEHIDAANPHKQYAPLASPTFSGAPKAPTPTAGNSTTQIATTAFVQTAITALVNGAPATLDTLKEIAAAINNDPNFSTTINSELAGKQPLDAALTAIAALATSANKLPYFSGVDTVTLTDLTAVGRELIAKGAVTDIRAYLGLGSLAIKNSLTAAEVGAVSKAGDVMSGRLAINADGEAVAIKGTVNEAASYVISRDASNVNQWYVGKGSNDSNDVAFYNYKGENRLFLSESGAVFLSPKTGQQLNLGGSQTNISGMVIPSDYANFDSRYPLKNAASKAVNGWFKDASTGLIYQWGTTDAVYDDTLKTITFPIAFPSACVAFLPTLKRSTTTSNPLAMLSVWGQAMSNASANLVFQSNDGNSDARTGLITYWAVGY
ncbi:phage tail-collar fiber domain-containing protein [Kosakonia cowanii]|uniref:phage tail-collar fiber domain-containing protein n=1 Tax=Kosakonia cowanii TaxID=208223 RepID=UPI001F5801E9|nr:phage tail protein [Kosakonia cowanii]